MKNLERMLRTIEGYFAANDSELALQKTQAYLEGQADAGGITQDERDALALRATALYNQKQARERSDASAKPEGYYLADHQYDLTHLDTGELDAGDPTERAV